MEVLVYLLSTRLATTLANQRAAFVEPWFANHLQGKFKAFKAAKYKNRPPSGSQTLTPFTYNEF
ncbi:unnamed protein product [Arabidopsis halleri]